MGIQQAIDRAAHELFCDATGENEAEFAEVIGRHVRPLVVSLENTIDALEKSLHAVLKADGEIWSETRAARASEE